MFFVYIFWVFFIGFLAYLIYGFIYKIIKGIGNEEERPQRAIALIATVVAVAVLLGIYFLFFKEKPEVKSRNEDNNTSYVKQRILTPQLIPFDGHHGFSVGLEAGWRAYPKGGRVKEIMPSGREFINTPGVDQDLGYQPKGHYKFFPLDSTTTGIEIWNYWE